MHKMTKNQQHNKSATQNIQFLINLTNVFLIVSIGQIPQSNRFCYIRTDSYYEILQTETEK